MVKMSDNLSLTSEAETKIMEEKCEILNIWDVLGRRWSLLILKNLSSKKVVRFNELKRSLKDISNTVLSDRLSELEQEGLITKPFRKQEQHNYRHPHSLATNLALY